MALVLQAGQKSACQVAVLAEVLALGAHGGEQDWGIELADGGRVDEFIDFFDAHYGSGWAERTIDEYVDLVFESAYEALDQTPAAHIPGLRGFVAHAIRLTPERAQYWADFRDEVGNWPISDLIREATG